MVAQIERSAASRLDDLLREAKAATLGTHEELRMYLDGITASDRTLADHLRLLGLDFVIRKFLGDHRRAYVPQGNHTPAPMPLVQVAPPPPAPRVKNSNVGMPSLERGRVQLQSVNTPTPALLWGAELIDRLRIDGGKQVAYMTRPELSRWLAREASAHVTHGATVKLISLIVKALDNDETRPVDIIDGATIDRWQRWAEALSDEDFTRLMASAPPA